MQGRITAQAFSFDQQFKPYQKDEFVMVVLSPLYFKLTFFHEIIAIGKLHNVKHCSSVSMLFACLVSLKVGDLGVVLKSYFVG